MKHVLFGVLFVLVAVPHAALAWQRVPAGTGTVKVSYLQGRNAPAVMNDAGFYFVIDTTITFTGTWCGQNPTTTFAIPRADPNQSTVDNPAYRDYVEQLMLAYSLNKPIALYVDGCMPGYPNLPKVVGIDVFP